MRQDDTGKPRRTERLLGLRVEAQRLSLRPRRFGPCLALFVLVYALVCACSFLPWFDGPPPRWSPAQYQALPGGGHIRLAPPQEIDAARREREHRLRQTLHTLLPVLGGALGLLAFLIGNRVFRSRIVLDRAGNAVLRDGRRVCGLNEVSSVELDDLPRAFRMNQLALVLAGGQRLSLLIYDFSADRSLLDAAQAIAAFAGVPLKPKEAPARHKPS